MCRALSEGDGMTHPSKRKGSGFELECVKLCQEAGLAAVKVPLSGALPDYPGDVTVPVRGVERSFQCKRRARAFGTLYGWMSGAYALLVRDDHTEPLVVMRARDFWELCK